MTQRQLQALRSSWYKKLEKEGFKDIEDLEGRLKWTGHSTLYDEFAEPVSSRKDYSSKVWKISQAEYYRLAAQYVHDKKFPNKEYKKAWILHSEGKSLSEIGQIMKLSRDQVWYRINKMHKEFYK